MSEHTEKSVRETYEVLKVRMTQPVAADFVQFLWGKELLGVVKKTLAMKLAGATSDFRLSECLRLSSEAEANEITRTSAMQKAAALLASMGEMPADAGELVDVRTCIYDKPFCQAPRLLCRKLGLMTDSIRLTAYDAQGRVVLALRRADKPVGGGLWDSLAAGLVKASEKTEQALYRELFEEAGLTSVEVEIKEGACFVQTLPVPEGYLREIVRNYEGVLKEGVKLQNRDGEVAEFKAFDPFEALRMAEQEKLMYAAGLGIAETQLTRMGHRIEEKWLHYRGQILI